MASAWGSSWSTFWGSAWSVIGGGTDPVITDDRNINVFRNVEESISVRRKTNPSYDVHGAQAMSIEVFKGTN